MDFNDVTPGVSNPSGEGIAGVSMSFAEANDLSFFRYLLTTHSLQIFPILTSDIYAALRLGESCIGINFRTDGSKCNSGSDPCLTCSGVRDVDYQKHQSNSPHTFTWLFSNCGSWSSTCFHSIMQILFCDFTILHSIAVVILLF